MKIRINELAKELEIKCKSILDVLPELGITELKTHSSPVDSDEAERIRRYFASKSGSTGTAKGLRVEIKPKIDFSKVHKPGDIARLLKEREIQQRSPAPRIISVAPPPKIEEPVKAKLSSDMADPAIVITPKIDFSKVHKPGDVAKLLRERELQQHRPAVPVVALATEGIIESKLQSPATPLFTGALPPTAAITSSASSDLSIMPTARTQTLVIPRKFSFYARVLDFDHVLKFFDWTLKDVSLLIDISSCESANFQALALLIQYAWYLTLNGCSVTFKYGTDKSGPTKMLRDMGAIDWPEILATDGRDFGDEPGKKTYALRRRSDVSNTINNARRAIRNYTVGFPEYLSYIISELLYNATEHGQRTAMLNKGDIRVPAIFQFGYYPMVNRLAFFFTDLGMGIKAHLEQVYSVFPTHQEAIKYALNPNVSGTFHQQSNPYATKDNAGMGLTYSSSMLKRLKGDMFIVSHNGMVHISPEDVTTRSLRHFWNGTFVLINLNINDAPPIALKDLLSEIRVKAQREIDGAREKEQSTRYHVSLYNYFGKWAEDKDAAITFRDRHLIPAIEAGKRIDLDFRDVETAPHSFLNALLATPVRLLGLKAYQWIRVCNASGSIHEIIDTIVEGNLPEIE
jgi:hypothetical protein